MRPLEVSRVDYTEWFPERIAQLRAQKNVSARDMSLSLGQSESYINKIENRHTLPSMTGFFYICEYLDITPRDFFDLNVSAPGIIRGIMDEASKLSPEKAAHLLQVIKDINSD